MLAISTVAGCGGVCRCFGGGRNGGLGENLEPGRDFAGPGGFRVFPSAFPDWSPLLSVYSCSRAVVFPTSTTLLFERLRSGTRRRRAASASAQAAGGTGPGTRRTAPTRAGAALYGACAVSMRGPYLSRCSRAARADGRSAPSRNHLSLHRPLRDLANNLIVSILNVIFRNLPIPVLPNKGF